jgi:RecB family endonuclease NucS
MSTFVEFLYYKIHNSVLLGKSEDAKMYLHFLREEYINDKQQFKVLINDERWQNLKKLGKIIDNGLQIKSLSCNNKSNETLIKVQDNSFEKQYDLIKQINLFKEDLRICLKADKDFNLTALEYPTKYGKVDLLAEDSSSIFPIEIKKDYAKHDVVSQIDKYILHFKLGLIYKNYRYVKGIVIANGFSEYVLSELYKFEVIPILYRENKNKKLEFFKV